MSIVVSIIRVAQIAGQRGRGHVHGAFYGLRLILRPAALESAGPPLTGPLHHNLGGQAGPIAAWLKSSRRTRI
jgi:hypothetical protein